MGIRGAAYVAGAFEHPLREIPHLSLAQIHAEVALGALADSGLSLADVDGYFCGGDAPGIGPLNMAEYLGLQPSYVDSTEGGGASYLQHVGHACAAIAAGKCNVALITLAGKPRTTKTIALPPPGPDAGFESPFGPTTVGLYALVAARHMYEYGTTSEDLAEVKVAASLHAQHNPNALLRKPVTVEEVVASPMVSAPLHRLDCCVRTDGGGAVVLVSPAVASTLQRTLVKVLGHGESLKHTAGGRIDLTYTGAVWSGPRAFDEAGVTPRDIGYASIYDSFTIAVLEAIEDLGFCEKGEGGRFVRNGGLVAPFGRLPFNTDGGGLCNNHPGNRGGMTKLIEAVRQLRGEAHPAVQVPDCELALAHATGVLLGTRSVSSTVILGRADA
jgi:acetyl-CoA C-acetyltransferase